VARDFHADAPGSKLVGDITYLPTWEGWPWQFIAILSGRVPEQRKVPLTWENVGVEANILL
jgi:transposase InsO family protein